MPRYFFNTAGGSGQQDTEGLELPNLGIARREAIKFAGSFLSEDPDLLWDGHEFRVQVTDSSKRVLITVIMLAVDTEQEIRHGGQ